jgi:hypothetical protein
MIMTNADHIEAAANVSDMNESSRSADRRLFDEIVAELSDHPPCLLGSGALVGFLVGYLFGIRRTGPGDRWH